MNIKRRFGCAMIGVFWSLLAAYPAAADLIIEGDFNIEFNDFFGEMFTGMFSSNDVGDVVEFMAEIGSCGVVCVYDVVIVQGSPWDGLGLELTVNPSVIALGAPFVSLVDGTWMAFNVEDVAIARTGSYVITPKAVPVPEPSGLLLLFAGLSLLAAVSLRVKRRHA